MRKLNLLSGRVRSFECLEARTLLAGNVTAGPGSFPGDLRIIGDDAANNIQISQLANGDWKVQGFSTKVNGSNSAQTFSGITQLAVDLMGGNDVIKVSGGTLLDELDIGTEGGSDVVNVVNVQAAEIFVDSGAGNDSVTVTGCSSNDRFEIHTGDGSDSLLVNKCQAVGAMELDTSDTTADGNDVVQFSDLSANTLFVNDKHGNDVVVGSNSATVGVTDIFDSDPSSGGSNVVTLTGLHSGEAILADVNNGTSVITVNKCTAVGELYVDTEGSSAVRSTINVSNSSTQDQFDIDASPGADVITVANVTAITSSYIHAYTGNNVINVSGLKILQGDETVQTGNGNDTILLTNVTVHGGMNFDAGNGNNDVSFNNVSVGVGANLSTGNDNDVITLINVTVGDAFEISTLGGTDAVTLNKVTALVLGADVGPGNFDSLSIINCTAAVEAFADSGGTNGTIVGVKNHFATAPGVSGFAHRISI